MKKLKRGQPNKWLLTLTNQQNSRKYNNGGRLKGDNLGIVHDLKMGKTSEYADHDLVKARLRCEHLVSRRSQLGCAMELQCRHFRHWQRSVRHLSPTIN